MDFLASVCQPSALRMLICPEASSAQNNIAAVSADGSTVWVLIRRSVEEVPLSASGSHGGRFFRRAALHQGGSTLDARTSAWLYRQCNLDRRPHSLAATGGLRRFQMGIGGAERMSCAGNEGLQRAGGDRRAWRDRHANLQQSKAAACG